MCCVAVGRVEVPDDCQTCPGTSGGGCSSVRPLALVTTTRGSVTASTSATRWAHLHQNVDFTNPSLDINKCIAARDTIASFNLEVLRWLHSHERCSSLIRILYRLLVQRSSPKLSPRGCSSIRLFGNVPFDFFTFFMYQESIAVVNMIDVEFSEKIPIVSSLGSKNIGKILMLY